MAKLFYTIGEVADMIKENTSLVRYWSNTFSKFINPSRTKKGNRMFTPEDVETIKKIHHLVNVEGYTLDGVARELKKGTAGTEKEVKVLESLKDIKGRLVEIKNML